MFSCSALKLDRESNCLNDKAACFKWDITRPKFDSAVEPQAGQIVSLLPYIDLRFSEELKEPTAADFQLLDVGATSLKIMSVEKIANFTYRLNLSGSVQNGPIRVRFTNVKDYAGNILSGPDEVQFTGNVDISVIFDFDSVTNPNFHAGVSNWVTGGYRNTTIKWYHDYTSDPNNTYQVFVTTGSISCPATLTGGPLAGGVANTQTQTFDRTADFTSGPRSYRIVVCIRNESQNKKGVGSVLVVRDDDPPVVSHLPLDGDYNSAQSLTISCSPNKDKIYYSQNAFPNWTGLATDPSDPADPYNNATGALNGGLTYTGPIMTPNPSNPTRTKYRYGCFDIAGNWSTIAASTAPTYVVDTTLPEVSVTLGAGYRGYVSTGGYTSTTLEFTTNQSGTPYRIVSGATSCAALDGTSLIGTGPFNTPAAGTLISHTIPATSFSTASGGVNNVYICVQNPAGTKWGTASLQIIRDDVRPTTIISVGTGSYGAQQSVVVTCSDNADKIAYTTDGTSPSFFANGEIQNGFSHTGPYTTPEGVTTFKYLCRDKAGNEELAVSTQTYTIDSLLPTITVLGNTNPAISTAGSKTSTTISWRSSRASRPYSFRVGGTNCSTATPLTPAGSYSGTTATDTNTVHATQINAADLAGDASYTIRICVTNLVGDYGSASFTVMKDTTAPVIAALAASPSLTAVDTTNFTLSWSPASDTGGSGVAMYRIYRSLNSNSYPGYPNTPDYSATSSPATITMPDSQKYFLRIVPVDAAGNIAGGAIPYYNELTTKPSINIVLAGNSGSLMLTDGSQSPVSVASSMAWTTVLGTGQTYSFNITSQPGGQVCAIKEKQFGILSSDLTININCVNGQMVGGRFQAIAASGMAYQLYRTRATAWASNYGALSLSSVNSIAVSGGNIYFGSYLDCDTVTAGNQFCVFSLPVAGGSVSALITNLSGTVRGIASDGTNLYFTTISPDNRLYKFAQTAGTLIEVASGLSDPHGLVLDATAAYICNRAANEIVKIDLATGTRTSLVSGLTGGPIGIGATSTDLYFTVWGSSAIYRMAKSGGTATVVYGSAGTAGFLDQNGTAARFVQPHDLVYDGVDNFFVTDFQDNRVRRIRVSTGRVTTLAGDGSTAAPYINGIGPGTKVSNPVGIGTDGRNLFISLHGPDKRIVKLGDAGLTGHWPLSGNITDYASDATPAAASWVGTAAYGAGRFSESSGAAVFDGSKYISTKDISFLANQPFTLAAWINVGDYTSVRPIFGNVSNYEFQLYIGTNGSVNFQNWYNSGALSNYLAGTAAGVIKPNTWVHVAYVFRNSNGPQPGGRIFINGHDMTVSSTLANSSSLDSFSTNVTLGATLSYPSRFVGSMADARIYNRLLTDAEINQLAQDANATLAGSSYNTGATELVSYFPIDQLTGNDYGPAGLNLTNSSAAPIAGVDGDYPGAVDLSGSSSSYLGAASTAGLPSGAAPRTLCAFVRPTGQPTSGSPYPIISYGSSGSTLSGSELMYYYAGANDYRVAMSRVDVSDAVGSQVMLPQLAWSHVCGTNDGAVTRIYVNGVEIPTVGSNSQSFNSTNGVLQIGRRSYSPALFGFKGQIDEARIYNKALSATEIRQLSALIPAGLIARYDLKDDAVTGKVLDLSGWGNNLAINGAAQVSDRFSIANAAYTFNGMTGYMIGLSPATGQKDNISMAAWVRMSSYPASIGYIVENGNFNGHALTVDSAGILTATCPGAGNTASSFKIPLNAWVHVAATFTTAGNWKIYMNGTSQTVSGCDPLVPSGSFSIGARSDAAYFVNGVIDDVRVYSRVLASSEIQSLIQWHNRRMYVTNSGYIPGTNFTSALTADNPCNANSAKPTSGYFKALIADTLSRRACASANCGALGNAEHIDWIFQPGTGYYTADGTSQIFTTDSLGLTPATWGIAVSGNTKYWTGINSNWTSNTLNNCGNWTTTTAVSHVPGQGNSTNVAGLVSGWVATESCALSGSGLQLLCVEQ